MSHLIDYIKVYLFGYQTTVHAHTIKQTEDNYSLEGKIAPRFHNEGETDVIILNITVKPGEMFNCSANTFFMQGNINIIMSDDRDKNKLVCIYNSLQEKKDC
ncbi:hypothetical protein [Aquimarina aggregata]|uniref:hypothetical protein n=1 Tax=Aquimarina aggregata TaxID=1642818 RepID=UPI002490C690|nr:hypothetical protein [Aquimarina aggregata]